MISLNFNRHISLAFRILLALGMVLLAYGLYSSQQRVDAWLSQWNEGDEREDLLDHPEAIPPRSREMRRVAEFATDHVFPRKYSRATEIAENWMNLRPFSTEPWVLYGRSTFMLGNREDGLEAISFASELAPNFPAGRLEAIPVMILSGRRDEAISLAREVANLDSQAPFEVVNALLEAGFPAEESFQYAVRDDLAVSEALRFLNSIPARGAETRLEIYQNIPENYLREEEFRRSIIHYFREPMVFPALRELWQREDDLSATSVEVSESLSVILGSPGQATKPKAAHYFGWQEPRSDFARSIVADVDGSSHWRIVFREGANSRRWLVHRGLASGMPGELKFTIRLSTPVPTNQGYRLIVGVAGKEHPGLWTSPQEMGEFDVPATVDYPGGDHVVTFQLQRRHSNIFQSVDEIDILDLKVEATP